ncbi:SapC family protein [Roseinatronobacter alkalisoli]|uniref:SapC family protein n=1 Tax=Roseinatronobacter alkalisoli TaxID=3028235 RepID=A0ABT5T5N8_9RHOB|nr:SapC family protein [Roseinatronobacter sp. HJB301]MDD7970279.1 SapC family protein [Roseinatronobacter sp. HJB301]
MTKQLLIYENAVPISAAAHADVSVRTGYNWNFAAQLNSVPVLVPEMEPACAEMPIVFTGQADSLTPVALMGLQSGENLFVTADGGWSGRYIPAFLRRYPFVFAETGADGKTLTLCIDEAYEGVNRAGRGERLFDSEGTRTQYLGNMLKFTTDYQTQHNLTRAFCQTLTELALLEPAVATVTRADGTTATLTGFQRVNRDKLAALPDDRLAEMFRNGMLGLIYFHIASLGHLAALGQRDTRTAAPSDAPAQPAEESAQA